MIDDVKFKLFESVRIIDLDKTPARVNQICIGVAGTTYEVTWFHNGELKRAWLTEFDLVSRERY